MTPTNHPLTETDVRDACHRILSTAGDLPIGYRRVVNLFAETVAALAPADPHHDPRPWQDCTREDIREGDLVEARYCDRLYVGVAHYQDEGGDWRTEGGWLIIWNGRQSFRRIPAPTPPAEVVELPTERPAHITDVEDKHGDVCTYMAQSKHGAWVGVDQSGNTRTWWAETIAAFTLPDGTRARRDGERPDGTPRFVKVQEGEEK